MVLRIINGNEEEDEEDEEEDEGEDDDNEGDDEEEGDNVLVQHRWQSGLAIAPDLLLL